LYVESEIELFCTLIINKKYIRILVGTVVKQRKLGPWNYTCTSFWTEIKFVLVIIT